MKRFYLQRNIDQSKISGTGRVVDGVQFQDGTVVIHWRSQYHSTTVFPSLQAFNAIHLEGHPGCSKIVWIDDDNA